MVLRFTNASGSVFNFQSSNYAVQNMTGTGSSPAITTLMERAFRDGAAYLRRVSQPRIITISFYAVGETQTHFATRQEVTSKLSPALGLGTLEYQPTGASEVYAIDCSVVRLELPREIARPFHSYGTVQFECPFPFWRGATEQSQSINVNAASVNGTITNSGGLPVFPTVTIGEALAQTYTDPRWTNTTTNEDMVTSGLTVNSSNHLVVDHFLSSLQLNTGAIRINNLTIASKFWALEPGDNSVTCYRNTATGTLVYEFNWYTLFSGV